MLLFVLCLWSIVAAEVASQGVGTTLLKCSTVPRISDVFRCSSQIDCIEKQFVCDGVPDCPDASDETACSLLNEGINTKGGYQPPVDTGIVTKGGYAPPQDRIASDGPGGIVTKGGYSGPLPQDNQYQYGSAQQSISGGVNQFQYGNGPLPNRNGPDNQYGGAPSNLYNGVNQYGYSNGPSNQYAAPSNYNTGVNQYGNTPSLSANTGDNQYGNYIAPNQQYAPLSNFNTRVNERGNFNGDSQDIRAPPPALPPPPGHFKYDCLLPPYPAYGTYEVENYPDAGPGDSFSSAAIILSCFEGYAVLNPETSAISDKITLLCVNGRWSAFPQCVRMCEVTPDPSVKYTCQAPGSSSFKTCEPFVPEGTTVKPECNRYYSRINHLTNMKCRNGSFDKVAKCEVDCGRVTDAGDQLIIKGQAAKRGELPWHAGIYKKTTNPYQQICGGTLVSNNVVISAAHCFWHDVHKKLPESSFAVAVGKLYRDWSNKLDTDWQHSDVKHIMIPEHFQGEGSSFQADLAVVILKDPFMYKGHVKPVCLSFDKEVEKLQLKDGKAGQVAGWGLTGPHDPASETLNVVKMPFIDYKTCLANVPASFQMFVTVDKLCAGYRNGTAVCHGDSGGGLSFPLKDEIKTRYYLRGIVSTAPVADDKDCNDETYATFTKVSMYEDFIKEAMQTRD